MTKTDNLLENGLNSILATQFVWQATQSGVSLSVLDLFTFPTVEKLTAELERQQKEDVQEEPQEEQESEVVGTLDRVPLTDGEKSMYHN